MGILSCTKLTKTYGEKKTGTLALSSFTYDFPNYGLVSILGKSGSGKSTLLCLLSLIERPTSGKVFFENDELNSLSEKSKIVFLRKKTAFIFQHYGLFENRSVIENVTLPLLMNGYGKKDATKKAETILLRFGLQGFSNRIVGSLSGGEKQRVAICRALIKKPRIIFADEPTGALDGHNGEEVMKMLSIASKSALVIMVSHNKELVERYSDRILVLKDGKLVSNDIIRKEEGVPVEKTNTCIRSFWIFRFLSTFFKEDRKRNVLTALSGVLGSVSILLSLGYLSCSGQALNKKKSQTMEYLVANISKKEVVNYGNSPISLSREKKPSLEEISDYLYPFNFSIHHDYSFFFPSLPLYELEGEDYSDSAFVPIYDSTLAEYGSSLLKEGVPSEEERICYVNDVFAEKHKDSLGKEIGLEMVVPIDSGFTHDEVKISYRFAIKGVFGEFSYMNTPKVYFPYFEVEKDLKNTILENHSEQRGETITALGSLDIGIADETSYRVFFHNPSEMDSVYQKIKQGGELVITSNAYMVFDSFSSLSEAFSLCLWMLFAIALFGVIGINAMSFFSLYLKRRKETALLFSLGAKKEETIAPFLIESSVISFIYCAIAIGLFIPLKELFNRLLGSLFGIENLIGMPSFEPLVPSLLFILLFVLCSILISLLSSSIPILLSIRKGLRKELRDE